MTKFTAIFFCFLCTALVFAMPTNLTYAEEVKKVRYCPNYCGCFEADLLKSRIAEAEGAIKGFEAAKRGRGRVMFSQNEDIKIWGEVVKAINSELKSRGLVGLGVGGFGLGAGGFIRDSTCDITIKYDGSPCIQESLRRHERLHQDVCRLEKSRRRRDGTLILADYRDGMTAIQFIDEEISAYNTELAYLRSEYHYLIKLCDSGTILLFDSPKTIIGNVSSRNGRSYTCERKRLSNIFSDTETYKRLLEFFGF